MNSHNKQFKQTLNAQHFWFALSFVLPRNAESEPERFGLLNWALALKGLFMSKYYSEAPLTYPDKDEVLETRRIKHEKHLDYFYGDFWCTYVDSENDCYLECDKGHFSVKFEKVKITRTEYEQLKKSTISVKQVLMRH